jgi:hypothetical protein
MPLYFPFSPNPPKRRYKELSIQPEHLIALCLVNGAVKAKGMPADARFVSGSFDERSNRFLMVVESDTFEETVGYIPEMSVSFTTSNRPIDWNE